MFLFIRKRLELKIIVSLTLVIACMIGVYTYIDIGHMRTDTIRTSERTLGALAAAVKGTVIASMKKGHHELVKNILDAVNVPDFIDRVMIYDGDRSKHTNSKVPITIWWTEKEFTYLAFMAGFGADYVGSYECSAPWRPDCFAACYSLHPLR